MPGLLQVGFRIEIVGLEMACIFAFVKILWPGCDDWIERIALIGASDLGGAGHGDRMPVTGAAFGDHQVVIVAASRQMRRFNAAAVGTAVPDALRVADDAVRLRRIFHQADRSRFFIAFASFPLQ